MISTVSFRVSVLDISAAPPRAHALTRTHLACSAFARGSAILKLQRRGGNSTNINKSVSKIRLTPTQQTQFGGKAVAFFFFVYSEIRCKGGKVQDAISVGYQIKCLTSCQPKSIIQGHPTTVFWEMI